MISLTTAKIDLKNGSDNKRGLNSEDRKQDNTEPDDHATPTSPSKRQQKEQQDSPRSIQSNKNKESIASAAANEYGAMRSSKSGGKKHGKHTKHGKNHGLHIQYEHNSHKAGSNGSVTVSMRDDSIMHMSVNSVTDNNFIIHKGEDA